MRTTDIDPQETREWLEALDAVATHEGSGRAGDLIDRVLEHARETGTYDGIVKPGPYVNTIPPDREPAYPGDLELEHRVRALIRWNAMATVLQANAESSELGGHIASYQSAATLYEVGFNHFWRAPQGDDPGDLIYMQGHSAPGFYARAFLEGRLSLEQLRGFRQEVSLRRPLLLPAPVADAGLLAVPHGLDGPRADHGHLPGPVHEVPQGARPDGHVRAQGVGVPGRRRDGRAGVARRDLAGGPRAARQPRLRHQLQPAAARRAGTRQRQDHPGARHRVPRRGLERDQGDLGLALGPVARRRSRRPPAGAHGRGRRRRVPDVQVAQRRLRARALLRRRPGAARARQGHDATRTSGRSTAAATTRSRSTPPTPPRWRRRAGRR